MLGTHGTLGTDDTLRPPPLAQCRCPWPWSRPTLRPHLSLISCCPLCGGCLSPSGALLIMKLVGENCTLDHQPPEME